MFCENSQWLKAVSFIKDSILDFWQGSEYSFEDAKETDSAAI